jgi:hypothetical protein
MERHEVGYGPDKMAIEVDIIGKMLFKVDGFNCIRYIEEILEVDIT